jgi:hypothetical protein
MGEEARRWTIEKVPLHGRLSFLVDGPSLAEGERVEVVEARGQADARVTESSEYDWEKERETIADMAAKDAIPDAEFPGHKGIYMANLEGWLGGRFPALLAERDVQKARADRVTEAARDLLDSVESRGVNGWLATVPEEKLAVLLGVVEGGEDRG